MKKLLWILLGLSLITTLAAFGAWGYYEADSLHLMSDLHDIAQDVENSEFHIGMNEIIKKNRMAPAAARNVFFISAVTLVMNIVVLIVEYRRKKETV